MNPQAEEGSHIIIVVTFSSILHVSVNRFCQDTPPVPAAVELGQQGCDWCTSSRRKGLREELVMSQPDLVSGV